jgi:pimeloyl-ACP methyl ester carboxylesterase
MRTIPDAGHIPQETHPGDYTAILTDFIQRPREVLGRSSLAAE